MAGRLPAIKIKVYNKKQPLGADFCTNYSYSVASIRVEAKQRVL